MNVYPLERPGEGKTIYSQFLRKQHEEMLSLLNDPCPLVRVIAIKVSTIAAPNQHVRSICPNDIAFAGYLLKHEIFLGYFSKWHRRTSC